MYEFELFKSGIIVGYLLCVFFYCIITIFFLESNRNKLYKFVGEKKLTQQFYEWKKANTFKIFIKK